jgi:GAF domain-containing protein
MADPQGLEFVRRIFDEGWRYVEKLAEENDRLRLALARAQDGVRPPVEDDAPRLREQLKLAQEESARAHAKLDELQHEFARVVRENREFATGYVNMESRVSSLSALYAASHELHARLDVSYVLSRLQEIVVDLLGSESFAIYVADEAQRVLTPAVVMDVPPLATQPVTLGVGDLGRAALDTNAWVEIASIEVDTPRVVVPLRVHERLVGALAIFQFLPQKRSGVTELDRELFQLLSAQAATALHGAMLFAKEQRRAATLSGLVELVRSTRVHA